MDYTKPYLKGNESETYYFRFGTWFLITSVDTDNLPQRIAEKDLPDDLEDVSFSCLDQSHFETIEYCNEQAYLISWHRDDTPWFKLPLPKL